MPQWVQLPPNLVPEKHTMGKSIYTTDYSSMRPGFQLHLQKARGSNGSKHRAQPPKKPSRKAMRAYQTGDYLDLKRDFERALSTVEAGKRKDVRLNVDITTPDISRSGATQSDKDLVRTFIEPTLELVEEAWRGEATTTKRNRDRLYGLAGRKIELQSRPERKEPKKQGSGLPGVNNWLRGSNEYEKAVVYNFMDAICKASNDHVPVKVPVPKSEEKRSFRTHFPKELYHQQRAKSARSQRILEKPSLPPRPRSVGSMRDEDKLADSTVDNHVMEHAHYHHPHHTEGKCEFCDYMRVKKLLEHLNKYGSNSFGDATLSHLLRPRMDATSQYVSYVEDDYVHENSFFSNTNARDRGYFVIAPDWVSERKNLMATHYR